MNSFNSKFISINLKYPLNLPDVSEAENGQSKGDALHDVVRRTLYIEYSNLFIYNISRPSLATIMQRTNVMVQNT